MPRMGSLVNGMLGALYWTLRSRRDLPVQSGDQKGFSGRLDMFHE